MSFSHNLFWDADPAYFDDTGDDLMPTMFVPLTWNEVKKRITSAVQTFVKFV